MLPIHEKKGTKWTLIKWCVQGEPHSDKDKQIWHGSDAA